MKSTSRLILLVGVVAVGGIALVGPLLGHAEERSKPLAHPDGEVQVKASKSPGLRVFELRTLDDRDEVEVQLEASLDGGRMAVAVIDPSGRHRADLEGGAATSLQVETGKLRLVPSPRRDDEAPRGIWRVEVSLTDSRAHYTLRYRGFSLVGPEGAGHGR